MTPEPREHGWLPHFRRVLAFLRPHRRPLIIGLVAAVGVSLFYTFSVSSIVPVLKIIFAEHESIVDWLHRAEAERRLGIALPADLPDNSAGLRIRDVRQSSPAADNLEPDDWIVAVGGTPMSSYTITRLIADHVGTTIDDVRIRQPDGQEETVTLPEQPHAWWWPAASWLASTLPAGDTPESRFFTLLIIMVVIVVIALLGGICRFVNEGLVATAVQRTMHDVRTRLASHTLRLPMTWHSSQPSGDTLARFATDLAKVEVGLSTLFGKVIREPLKAIGVISLTLLIDWRMLIIGVLGLPIGGLVIRSFGRMVKRAQRRASESWGRLLDHLGERLAGIRVVKAANMEGAESARFEREGRELTKAQTHIELVDAASNPVLETLASLAVAAFILYGGYRVFHNEVEPYLLFGAVVCLGGIFDPLRKMGNVNNRLQAAESSARRLFEVMDRPTEEIVAEQTKPALPPMGQSIRFERVSFAYPINPDRLVIDDIDLFVEKGQVVALVGPNGSGKTTLMALLLRFFDPTVGRILIDGHDIRDVSLQSLRDQIGLVTQDAVIFSDTVRANIAYGAPNATDEDILRAAKLARVDDFVRTLHVKQNGRVTRGYDAEITSRMLSGGQKQRIVLARAVVRDPAILILDEATSQVDSESERKIQEALEDVVRDRTTFIIAHRLSTVARADLTVVLNEGRIEGLGRPEELAETCAFYNTLVRTQLAHGV